MTGDLFPVVSVVVTRFRRIGERFSPWAYRVMRDGRLAAESGEAYALPSDAFRAGGERARGLAAGP